MVLAMKLEVTDPLVHRVFRQPLLSQGSCPLVTGEYEHEQIKSSTVR